MSEGTMSAPLWTFDEFITAMRGRPTGTTAPAIEGISIDSRTLAVGDAFFAIRGEALDGHDYVGKAAAQGAALAVIAEDRLAALGRLTLPLVVVSDVLSALEALGRAARARTAARIAAITGSVGKTTTKEMLARVLGASGPTHFSPASFNNHWGVPLTLARMPAQSQFGVFELGMNHAGEITRLVAQVRPHVAIITTIAPAHAAFFEDGVAGIARAKAEIFSGIEPGGAAILNRDNPQFEPLALMAIDASVERVFGFGEAADCEARLTALDLLPDRSKVRAEILGRKIAFSIGAPGRHLVWNALAVLLATELLGGDLQAAADSLGTMSAPGGRGARHTLQLAAGTALLIDDSYNANPTSMGAALAVLAAAAPGPGGRRIAVLGDMLELGADELALHAGLVEPLVAAGVDLVFLAGSRMAALEAVLPSAMRGHYAERAEALDAILETTLADGDVVMVKGSKGSRMTPLVERLLARYSGPVAEGPGVATPIEGQG